MRSKSVTYVSDIDYSCKIKFFGFMKKRNYKMFRREFNSLLRDLDKSFVPNRICYKNSKVYITVCSLAYLAVTFRECLENDSL